MNVYKAPNNPVVIQSQIPWSSSPMSIVAGDFYSVHWAWQPNANRSNGQGDEIESWADEHSLTCLIIGEPTHRAGNTLDLAWTNAPDT